MKSLTIKIEKDLILIKKNKILKPLPKKYISCLEALHDILKNN